jgi:hypothetical protein
VVRNNGLSKVGQFNLFDTKSLSEIERLLARGKYCIVITDFTGEGGEGIGLFVYSL